MKTPFIYVLATVVAHSLGAKLTLADCGACDKTIVETAVAADDFKTLVAAVEAADLVQTLSGNGPFTVFAPTNEAFAKLPEGTLKTLLRPENKERLQAILTYHVVPQQMSARAAYGLNSATTVNGQRLNVERRDGKLVVGAARIVATDIDCSNGVIHAIDQVLLPEEDRIPVVAEQAGQFDALLAAVTAAGLRDVLDGDGPFTVFAPNDDAFESLPEGTLETLLKPESKEKLVQILKYHVVSGRVYTDQAADVGHATTLLGRMVETAVSADGLRINDSLVLAGNLETANGVIHVVDSVLLPKAMSARQAMRILEDAIRRGVPVFNRGDHRECAAIYTTACQAITECASDEMPPTAMMALERGLLRPEQLHSPSSQAWALRHGMDSAWSDLRSTPAKNTGASTAQGNERVLFEFDNSLAAKQWRTTNDGVMGGRSDGRFQINESGTLDFFGTLSLENNGGFASVRSRGTNLGLEQGDSIVIRVRGDGREYSLNLYEPSRRMASSYRAKFKTTKDQWTEVRIPMNRFVATSFGRVIPNQELDPSQVNGLGVLLGDKKPGPFKLKIDWIKVSKTS